MLNFNIQKLVVLQAIVILNIIYMLRFIWKHPNILLRPQKLLPAYRHYSQFFALNQKQFQNDWETYQ